MTDTKPTQRPANDTDDEQQRPRQLIPPITNYTLSTVCPACGEDTRRIACKVRCLRCGFMWDCSEL